MYNSPIRIITSDLGMKVTEALDEQIYQSVLNVGIDVDKGELLRALQYDRGQYEMGYADGKADVAPGWISVKDRLPEYEEPVMGWDAEMRDMGIVNFIYGKFFDILDMSETNVTHWMPLPQLPKGD